MSSEDKLGLFFIIFMYLVNKNAVQSSLLPIGSVIKH